MRTADRRRDVRSLGQAGTKTASSRRHTRAEARHSETRHSETQGLSQAAIELLAELDAIEDYPDEPILLDKRGIVTATRRLDLPAGSVGTLGRLV